MADENENEQPIPPVAAPVVEPVAAPVDPVAGAAKKVADAEALLAAAKSEHAEEVKKATPPEPEAQLGKHVFVDVNATGGFSMLEIATTPDLRGYDAHNPPRTILVFGVSCEHVSEHQPSGCWQYRKM